MHRRDFLKMTGIASIMLMAPEALAAPGRGGRTLVLIEFQGGNDGLNTVIPYSDSTYYAKRPNLAVDRAQVLQLSDKMGLNPVFEPLMKLWKNKSMAVVNGVGYPEPNRSHFRSIEIWETASASDEVLGDGWLSRAWDGSARARKIATTADGIVIGDNDIGPLLGTHTRAVLMNQPEQFIREARHLKSVSARKTSNGALNHILSVQKDLEASADDLESYLSTTASFDDAFPKSRIGRKLAVVARLIAAKIPVPVMKVSLGSFDTHANQRKTHDRLLKELAEALSVFHTTLAKVNRWNDTLVMTYSEFGRRVSENASKGTDHGTAAPHFMLGGQVRGGLYGKQPSLSDLQGGDLKHHVDFRSMYTTVARKWWGLKQGVVDGNYAMIPCLRG